MEGQRLQLEKKKAENEKISGATCSIPGIGDLLQPASANTADSSNNGNSVAINNLINLKDIEIPDNLGDILKTFSFGNSTGEVANSGSLGLSSSAGEAVVPTADGESKRGLLPFEDVCLIQFYIQVELNLLVATMELAVITKNGNRP